MVNQDTFERKIADSSSSSFVNLTSTSYKKILVPHDGSEMSDIALRHAIYLSKISNAEIIIINVIEEDVVSPSTLLSFLRKEEEGGLKQSKEGLRNTIEGAIKKMLENKVKEFDKLELHLSYKVLVGNPADEIIKFAERSNIG